MTQNNQSIDHDHSATSNPCDYSILTFGLKKRETKEILKLIHDVNIDSSNGKLKRKLILNQSENPKDLMNISYSVAFINLRAMDADDIANLYVYLMKIESSEENKNTKDKYWGTIFALHKFDFPHIKTPKVIKKLDSIVGNSNQLREILISEIDS